VVSHMPCGHCRQFLAEIGSGDLAIRVRSRDFTLAQLLPESFGPRDLGVTSGVFGALSAASPGVSIERMTRAAAERSYAPHSAAQAGSPWSA